jgi:hypothetical protein
MLGLGYLKQYFLFNERNKMIKYDDPEFLARIYEIVFLYTGRDREDSEQIVHDISYMIMHCMTAEEFVLSRRTEKFFSNYDKKLEEYTKPPVSRTFKSLTVDFSDERKERINQRTKDLLDENLSEKIKYGVKRKTNRIFNLI